MSKSLRYEEYLRLGTLLAQQQPVSGEHDEMLFIVIHQVYELWFKQCLHELQHLRGSLFAGASAPALATLRRLLTIFKTLVAQVDILETMTPLSFNAFRARLQAASGFQSWQFRAVEFLLGHKRAAVLDQYPEEGEEHRLLSRLLREPDIYTAFLHYLQASGIALPAAALVRDPLLPPQADAAVQDALLKVYREREFEAQVCERLVDLDEGLQEWRYRHVKMVERTIGARTGTGGSAGAAYLRDTLFRPLFPDLWEIRSRL